MLGAGGRNPRPAAGWRPAALLLAVLLLALQAAGCGTSEPAGQSELQPRSEAYTLAYDTSFRDAHDEGWHRGYDQGRADWRESSALGQRYVTGYRDGMLDAVRRVAADEQSEDAASGAEHAAALKLRCELQSEECADDYRQGHADGFATGLAERRDDADELRRNWRAGYFYGQNPGGKRYWVYEAPRRHYDHSRMSRFKLEEVQMSGRADGHADGLSFGHHSGYEAGYDDTDRSRTRSGHCHEPYWETSQERCADWHELS